MSALKPPFPHVPHRTYSFTFLGSVKLILSDNDTNEKYEQFKSFFESYFNLSITTQQFEIKNADALRIKSSDSDKRFKFSRNNVEIIIDGNSYIDFETSLLPFIHSYSTYLTSIGAQVNAILLEKVNLWPTPNTVNIPCDRLLNVIFSEDLMSIMERITGNSNICEFYDEKSGTSIIVRNGVYNDKETNVVILDTLCNKKDTVFADDLISVLGEMNKLQFDSYHWSVREEVIHSMMKE